MLLLAAGIVSDFRDEGIGERDTSVISLSSQEDASQVFILWERTGCMATSHCKRGWEMHFDALYFPSICWRQKKGVGVGGVFLFISGKHQFFSTAPPFLLLKFFPTLGYFQLGKYAGLRG